MFWKDVVGYEGQYQVSRNGLVKSVSRTLSIGNGSVRLAKDLILAQKYTDFGYVLVGLCKDGDHKKHRVHRLVAEAWLGPVPELARDVNHKDGIKDNNSVDNLEYCTRAENIQHSFTTLGRRSATLGKFDSLHHNSQPIQGLEPVGMAVVIEYESLSGAGRDGYSISHISNCINGKRKMHQGLFWVRKPETSEFKRETEDLRGTQS